MTISGLFQYLSDREMIKARRIAASVLIMVIVLAVDLPLYLKGRETGRKVLDEEKRLNEIIKTGEEYISVRGEIDAIKRGGFPGGGAALSALDSLTARAGLKKKVSSIRPSSGRPVEGMRRTGAEISLEKVSLGDIERLVHMVEADERFMVVGSVSIKASYDAANLFNASILMNTVEKE